jgi:hypothetical protein
LRFSITITKTLEEPAGAAEGEGETGATGALLALGLAFVFDAVWPLEGPHAAAASRHATTVRLRITPKTLRSEPLEVA